MYCSKRVLVSVMLMACVIAVTSAIECYQCNTARNGNCGDKFSGDDNNDKCTNGGVCRKTITKDRGNLISKSFPEEYRPIAIETVNYEHYKGT